MEGINEAVFARGNDYSIYKCISYYNNSSLLYYLCVPDNYFDTYNMFIGFSKNDLNNLSYEEIVSEIKGINDPISKNNKSSLYAIPVISSYELEEAAMDNDNKLYSGILQKVQSMTVNINGQLNSNTIPGNNIDQVITFIEQTESDTKFIHWLEIQMPNFIQGISIKQLHYNETTTNQEIEINPNEMFIEKENVKVRKLVQPKNNSMGFNSIPFIVLTLILALIIGIGVSYFIIK